jgi:hypothetical protein
MATADRSSDSPSYMLVIRLLDSGRVWCFSDLASTREHPLVMIPRGSRSLTLPHTPGKMFLGLRAEKLRVSGIIQIPSSRTTISNAVKKSVRLFNHRRTVRSGTG